MAEPFNPLNDPQCPEAPEPLNDWNGAGPDGWYWNEEGWAAFYRGGECITANGSISDRRR